MRGTITIAAIVAEKLIQIVRVDPCFYCHIEYP